MEDNYLGFIEVAKSNFFTKKYFDFQGTATKREYWYFILWIILVLLPLIVMRQYGDTEGVLDALPGLFMIMTFIPGMAVSARRLHDIGFSGWFTVLLTLLDVVLIGITLRIVLGLQASKWHNNQYRL